MLTLHRHSRTIARLTLVWFVLFIGSAIASSFIHSAGDQTVCSASGGMKATNTGDGSDGRMGQGIGFGCDCPLCATPGVPMPPTAGSLLPPLALAHAQRPVVAAWIAWITALPPNSRGPPAALR